MWNSTYILGPRIPIHPIGFQVILLGDLSVQIITTFPAGWSPQMVLRSKGIFPKCPKHSGLGISL